MSSEHHLHPQDALGCDCEYQQNLDPTTYTTSNYQAGTEVLAASWATPALDGGRYTLTTTLEFQVSSSGRTLDAEVRELGVGVLVDNIRTFAQEPDEWHIVTVEREVTLPAGVSTLELYYKKLSGGGTISVRNIEFILREA